MKWYLIWYIVVTLDNGVIVRSPSDSFPMSNKTQCELAIPIKQTEVESMLGERRRTNSRTVAPTPQFGTVTQVVVGCSPDPNF